MKTVQITSAEILNSIPSKELLNLAIIKLLMEGNDWRKVAHEFPNMCWEFSIALQEEAK